MAIDGRLVELLRCPKSGEKLSLVDGELRSESGKHRYEIHADAIPLFAQEDCSTDARRQRDHYDQVASQYLTNLTYPHTQAYNEYLDDVFEQSLPPGPLGTVAEICCGHGEALALLGDRIELGIGVDISVAMLEAACGSGDLQRHSFLQGDATSLPIGDGTIDNVFMFGGIHHVSDRAGLFREIFRILKPGGRFFWREPVSDFLLWRGLRALIYRWSPQLDHETERPLLRAETEPPLESAGFRLDHWRTCGFLGFCVFMNSDVLMFNRLFRFVPKIASLTRFAARVDDRILQWPGMSDAGLQVVGVASKPD